MDIESLQKRMAEIHTNMEMTKTHYGKLEGHLEETRHWLNQLIQDRLDDESASLPDTADQVKEPQHEEVDEQEA